MLRLIRRSSGVIWSKATNSVKTSISCSTTPTSTGEGREFADPRLGETGTHLVAHSLSLLADYVEREPECQEVQAFYADVPRSDHRPRYGGFFTGVWI